MMVSISTMPERMERVISWERGLPSTSGEERRLVAILMPPSGLRISWATPAAISPREASFSRWMSRRLGLPRLGRAARAAPGAHPVPGVVEQRRHRQGGGDRAPLRGPAHHLPAPAPARLERAHDGSGASALLA